MRPSAHAVALRLSSVVFIICIVEFLPIDPSVHR